MTTTPATRLADTVRRMADEELSARSRLGYVALLLTALMMAGAVGSLWATEPDLPMRTQAAFASIVVIALSWAAFALWVLTHRRVLLARHSIVAGRMAITFTTIFVAGALAAGITTGAPAAHAAAGLGAVMLSAAVALLLRAHRNFARLTERRLTLERELAGSTR
jgi:membrane associated rhomboid family serine protease